MMDVREELAKMSETKRRQAYAKAYRYLAEQEDGEKTVCPTCGDRFPADTFTGINDRGTKICARCVFVIALYNANGITKKLTDGCLAPDKLNSKFRKILETEFYVNPVDAYQSHLGDMIRQEEKYFRIIDIPGDEYTQITAEDWPFHCFTEDDVKTYNLLQGEKITLRNADKPAEQFTREIYAIQRIPGKAAKKYAGNPKRKYACFIPAAA
jgi:hypothetical protein